jgi:hypothetical protein
MGMKRGFYIATVMGMDRGVYIGISIAVKTGVCTSGIRGMA